MLAIYLTVMIVCLSLLLFLKRHPIRPGRGLYRRMHSEAVLADIRKISKEPDIERQEALFFQNKLRALLLTALVAGILAALLEVKGLSEHELLNGRLLKREDYTGSKRTVALWARNASSGEKEKLSIEVKEKKYGKEALDKMLEEIEEKVPYMLLKDNPSADHVEKELSFPKSIEGYPFSISYRTNEPLILSSAGIVNEINLKKRKDAIEGVLVKVVMEFKYEDYSAQKDFYVRVYPAKEGSEASLFDSLKTEISLREEGSREQDYLELPEKVLSERIAYEEPASYESIVIFIIGLCAAFLLYRKKDEELRNASMERDKQMLSDYPMIVNKFALFYSVGMTTKGIILKLCKDYEEKIKREGRSGSRFAYEEMLKTRKKMEEGIGEIAAYEDYAKRCGLHKYRQLINLMEQAVIKGKSDISILLSDELRKAFLERKSHAKELTEEAGTKLLLPMFLMLFVVIVVIIVPAFMAFKM